MESKIKRLLLAYEEDIPELFNELDIELEDVLEILIKGGYIILPDWLDDVEIEDE